MTQPSRCQSTVTWSLRVRLPVPAWLGVLLPVNLVFQSQLLVNLNVCLNSRLNPIIQWQYPKSAGWWPQWLGHQRHHHDHDVTMISSHWQQTWIKNSTLASVITLLRININSAITNWLCMMFAKYMKIKTLISTIQVQDIQVFYSCWDAIMILNFKIMIITSQWYLVCPSCSFAD